MANQSTIITCSNCKSTCDNTEFILATKQYLISVNSAAKLPISPPY